jgi:cell division protein FtsI (penicillin-binding protein 3)
MDRQTILRRCRSDRDMVYLARTVSPETARQVAALELAGISFYPENTRHYPLGRRGSHVLGCVNRENLGCGGVEQKYNEDIAGRPGLWFVCRDAFQRWLAPGERPATAGHDLVLTLDAVVHHVAEEALGRAVAGSGAGGGSLIVMDPWTGDILALANLPDFDPNRYNQSAAEAMQNRAIGHAYEPGSTFKVFTFAAALEADVLDLTRPIDCGMGHVQVAGGTILDHKPFGLLTPPEILAHSSNVGTIRIAQRVGAQRFHRTIRAFGFGERTGVDLPAEERGQAKPPEQWSGRSLETIAFGQEVSVTPLQLCRAMAAVASDGVLRVPRLVARVLHHDGTLVRENPPRDGGRAVSERTAATLRGLLAGVLQFGTGKEAASEYYTAAGKTGTAEKAVEGRYVGGRYVASFVGFAPGERPRIVVAVVLDEPQGYAYHGGQVAAPVFRQVVEKTLRYLGLPSAQDEVLVALGPPAAAATEPASVVRQARG